MKRFVMGLAAAGLAMIALAGCVSADGAVRDVTDSDKFRAICQSEPLVHATFVVLAAENGVKASIIKAEATAHAVVQSVCSNPPQNVAAALVTAAEAYARVLAVAETAAVKESG